MKQKLDQILKHKRGKNLNVILSRVRNKFVLIFAGRMGFEMPDEIREVYLFNYVNLYIVGSEAIPGYHKRRLSYSFDVELDDKHTKLLEGIQGYQGDPYIAMDILIYDNLKDAENKYKNCILSKN